MEGFIKRGRGGTKKKIVRGWGVHTGVERGNKRRDREAIGRGDLSKGRGAEEGEDE